MFPLINHFRIKFELKSSMDSDSIKARHIRRDEMSTDYNSKKI